MSQKGTEEEQTTARMPEGTQTPQAAQKLLRRRRRPCEAAQRTAEAAQKPQERQTPQEAGTQEAGTQEASRRVSLEASSEASRKVGLETSRFRTQEIPQDPPHYPP